MTDTEIVNACRAVLWPTGQWPEGDTPTEWNADHLEALASLLELPEPPQGKEPGVGFQFENRRSITDPERGGIGTEHYA